MADETNDQGQQQQGEEASGLRSQLAETGGKLKLAERQLEFARHFPGVDPTSKPVVAMLSQYEGAMDGEALKAEAALWNIQVPTATTATPATEQPGDQGGAPQQQANQGVTEAERQAAAAAAALSRDGSQQQGSGAAHPVDEGLNRFNEALRAGKDREEASAEFLDSLLGAAANGDQRVILAGGRQGSDTTG